ncbi:LOW QUALITY PROTEIN: hypothetical protein PHMEG_00033848 [Phytophthora megakarya]|uniref:Polyprotein n=1 Tax=Phytophthora megakarya TaxID=4795 RepID=A0A225UUT1_9STRA|nr:LOW QUALITY PROTEIN: hypothetical protein PHMEG_00033848 [Phytophthora megakarya]
MEHLKNRYIGKTYFKYASEMTKLRKQQLDPSGNMSDHLGEIRRLMERIGLLGKPLDDYEKSVLLIGFLPSAYDNVVETFLASHPPEYEQLEHALEAAYDRRQDRKVAAEKNDDGKALYEDAVVVEAEDDLEAADEDEGTMVEVEVKELVLVLVEVVVKEA